MANQPKVSMVPVPKLAFDPDNARLHPDDNVAAIAHSLSTFGQPEPLVVRRGSNVVISGNGRLEAMRKLHWPLAAVVYVDWDDERARAYALVANRTAEMAKWDYGKVAESVAELGEQFKMEALGFDDSFLATLPQVKQVEQALEQTAAAEDEGPKHGKPVQCTAEQRSVFNQACAEIRRTYNEDYSEGRCLELIAADWLGGAR